jgi:hypothetical protein
MKVWAGSREAEVAAGEDLLGIRLPAGEPGVGVGVGTSG